MTNTIFGKTQHLAIILASAKAILSSITGDEFASGAVSLESYQEIYNRAYAELVRSGLDYREDRDGMYVMSIDGMEYKCRKQMVAHILSDEKAPAPMPAPTNLPADEKSSQEEEIDELLNLISAKVEAEKAGKTNKESERPPKVSAEELDKLKHSAVAAAKAATDFDYPEEDEDFEPEEDEEFEPEDDEEVKEVVRHNPSNMDSADTEIAPGVITFSGNNPPEIQNASAVPSVALPMPDADGFERSKAESTCIYQVAEVTLSHKGNSVSEKAAIWVSPLDIVKDNLVSVPIIVAISYKGAYITMSSHDFDEGQNTIPVTLGEYSFTIRGTFEDYKFKALITATGNSIEKDNILVTHQEVFASDKNEDIHNGHIKFPYKAGKDKNGLVEVWPLCPNAEKYVIMRSVSGWHDIYITDMADPNRISILIQRAPDDGGTGKLVVTKKDGIITADFEDMDGL